MQGSHTAVNLKGQIFDLVQYFGLENTFGYAITDNASENQACLRLLAEDLAFDARKRHVLCMGHVINLVAHKVLFGSDVESFEYELEHAVTAEAVELATWRRKGPIGKLHNIIRYILHSSERQDAFLALQTTALELSEEVENMPRVPLRLIRDNVTRWNSWYDAAVRAIELRDAIDEFTDGELVDYKKRLARHERRSQAAQKDPPNAPSILHDKLHPDDWHVITTYVAILKPCKQATMKLMTRPLWPINSGYTSTSRILKRCHRRTPQLSTGSASVQSSHNSRKWHLTCMRRRQ
jgi:hypothetical protein